jgi:hypothetical protein
MITLDSTKYACGAGRGFELMIQEQARLGTSECDVAELGEEST